MKIEYYIKKHICLTDCPNNVPSIGRTVKVGSTSCTMCNNYISKYITEGKRILECNFKQPN